MCGFVGVVGDRAEDRLEAVVVQSDLLAHRGPDASGHYAEQGVALAHRRLRIIELSQRSDQPICSPDGRYVLVYNGEVYNFAELGPHVDGDTLAMVAGTPPFALAPGRLRGMFAFALYDRQAASIHLARDRFGMKPLYYAMSADAAIFGSTARSVAELRGSLALDSEAISTYLVGGSVRGPATVFDGVRELPPGHTLTWADGRSNLVRYWEPPETAPEARDLRATVAESVAAHMVSDVPVALFLSGGLDSAILLALAKEAGAEITAITVRVADRDLDESAAAARTARHFGVRHQVIDAPSDTEAFDEYIDAADQPSVDGFNVFLVARAASLAGFRVALSGIGADELFAGYSNHRRLPVIREVNRLPAPVARALLRLARGNGAKVAEMVAAGRDLGLLHQVARSVFTPDQALALTGHTVEAPADVRLPGRPVTEVTHLELRRYLADTLLRDADVFGMASSVEIRTPFVDHEVLAAAIALPEFRRWRYGKRLLADALEDPYLAGLARHRKRGFTLPYGSYVRGMLSDRVDELVRGPLIDHLDQAAIAERVRGHRSGRSPDIQTWSLVVLDAWLRREQARRRPVAS